MAHFISAMGNHKKAKQGIRLNFQAILVAAQVAVSVALLTYASWSDYKTREVSNRVWAIYAPIAVVLAIPEFLLYDSSKHLSFSGSA